MAITTVLFDYSGVLTTPLHLPTEGVPYDPDAVFVEMAAALGSLDANPWHELERGEISLQAYVEYAESRVPGAGVLFEVGSEFNVMKNLELLEDRLALVAELKASGLRVGLVTNNVAEWQPYWKPGLPPGLFEVVIDSADVGCRKPEPAIYERAMQELDITDPATVLFVDDFDWNVEGAVQAGMSGVHCTIDVDLGVEIRAAI